MKKSYKVLVLTDHSGHSEQNSIYAILNQMLQSEKCDSILVASRGLAENQLFFEAMDKDALWATKIDESFKYTESGACLKDDLQNVSPSDFDLVFIRLPRPISDEFLRWLETIFNHAVIINNPSGIIDTSTKQYLLNFPGLCPDIKLCRSVADIKAEIAKYPIVLKPLKEYGGRGLLKMDDGVVDDGTNEHDTEEFLAAMEEDFNPEGYLSMKFLENVDQGDKRILVVGDEILAASLRIPAEGSWLCNVAQGGSSVATEITPEEEKIVHVLSPELKAKGILIYGVDTLVDDDGKRVLSEINTLSIGGFPQAERQTGKPIIKTLIQKIFAYVDERLR